MWRELISKTFDDAKFVGPASADAIARAETALGVALPQQLRALLLETDGVQANYSAPLVWPVAEIIAQNTFFRASSDFRDLFMPFDAMLFFGGEGNGDQYFYRILNGQIPDRDVYEWDHEQDNRVWFAKDLADHFRRSVPAD